MVWVGKMVTFQAGGGVLLWRAPPDVSCRDSVALYGSSRSLQVGVPKCDERRENRRLLPENSQQPDAKPLRRTSESGLLRKSEPERVRDRRRCFVYWGCAVGTVCGACVRARVCPPGKPNSHRLLAELRLTGLACWASGGYVLVSTWTLTGRGNRESSRAPADSLPPGSATMRCVFGCLSRWEAGSIGWLEPCAPVLRRFRRFSSKRLL